MPQDEHGAQTEPCDPSSDAIRKNLHELLRLSAQEVAQQLAQKSKDRKGQPRSE
jgi:hypothetical protein